MSSQMLQLQSRQDQEQEKLQQFADTVDSSLAEQSSSSEQLLDVIRSVTICIEFCHSSRVSNDGHIQRENYAKSLAKY